MFSIKEHLVKMCLEHKEVCTLWPKSALFDVSDVSVSMSQLSININRIVWKFYLNIYTILQIVF